MSDRTPETARGDDRGRDARGRAAPGPGPEPTDEELCRLVRDGEAWPLETLWQRHSAVARSWAAKKDPGAAEDIVAEAFASVFQALVGGGGPSASFRGYLYKTMDSLLATHWSSQRRMHQLDDLGGLPADDVESSPEALGDAQEQRAAAAALLELPERWRDVIVAVDVEGRPVQDVARSLGLSPNSTSVLLKRARGGLRKAWIQRLHRPTSALPDDCASAVEHFGIMRWGKPGARRRAAAERHLTTCDSCRSRYAQFIEQATTVGLGIAGLLALTREWRQKLVPALATSATVVASFSIPATIDQAPLAPPPSPAPVQIDESPARTGSGRPVRMAAPWVRSRDRATGLRIRASPPSRIPEPTPPRTRKRRKRPRSSTSGTGPAGTRKSSASSWRRDASAARSTALRGTPSTASRSGIEKRRRGPAG